MTTIYTDCDSSSYYSGLPSASSSSLESKIHDLIKSTHRNVLPYTSNSGDDDVWSALMDIDGWGSRVRLIYRAILMDDNLKGKPEGWNREHLWPKSYGVGYSGADFTDIHHLRPADWGVNAARGNKQFGSCSDSSDCRIPANDEAAADTSSDTNRWKPPAAVRGDIARALFYMHVRYDGDDDPDNKDLVLSDCPSQYSARLGYLSELLRWHTEDPVDSAEVTRNLKVCERYQGNRNPFVDHPEYVTPIFGEPKSDGEINCFDPTSSPTPSPTSPGVSPTPVPPPNPTPAPTSAPPPPATEGACNGLRPGDVIPIAMNSENPDSVIFLPLVDLPQFSTVYITDNAWTGHAFYLNEGTESFTVPEGGIQRGTTFGFKVGAYGSSWMEDNPDRSFALSTQGDTILVYCFNADADGHINTNDWSSVNFLSGLSTGVGGWAPRESMDDSSDYDFGTSHSAVPTELEGFAAPALPRKKNYGLSLKVKSCKAQTSCTREEVLSTFMNLDSWEGSNTDGYNSGLVDKVYTISDSEKGGGWLGGINLTDAMLVGIGVVFVLILSCVVMLLCKARRGGTKQHGQVPQRFELATSKGANLREVGPGPNRHVAGRRKSSKGVQHDHLRLAVSQGLGNARRSSKNKNMDLV
eukprot:CAMPEP_0197562116 /NCGR_PEP_ID=MMETSP1320-20131121/26344_1 /TAXON_ID=91990 /ORGANISM="Bolidomonas sp., Strain RCC2347" /LENGTH=637 /DNA_ID=CAMNT_0043123815 /DNA_START=45 /DNA_END=1958 /DNA_ORIENTATION=+